jgi:6-pyruvoyltetrahydropterin/6-carboxytetrahydropterin synthase
MPYELRIERTFRAAHALRLYDGSMEQSHHHDWRTLIYVRSQGLDAMEVVMDFHELERIVEQVISPLDGADLNQSSAMAGVNPSAERVAEYLFKAMAGEMPRGVALVKVTVTEAPGCRASYWE